MDRKLQNDKNEQRKVEGAILSLYRVIVCFNTESSEVRVLDFDKEFGNVPGWGDHMEAMIDYLYSNVHPEDRADFDVFTELTSMEERMNGKVSTSIECRFRIAGGEYRWYEFTICHAGEEDSTFGKEFLFLAADINERKSRILRDEYESRQIYYGLKERYDALFEENMKDEQTGCYNRKGLKYYMDMVLRKAQEENLYLFVCVSDLNGLKHLNDTYGHAAGDEAIAVVSRELLNAAPFGSRIVRTGGDEFLLFAALTPDSDEPERMGEKLDAALDEYNVKTKKDDENRIGASYGYVFAPFKEGMENLDEYIETADRKMYEMRMKKDRYRR